MTASHEDERPDARSLDAERAGVTGPASDVVARRRRLIRVGLYAAPVLSSLAGRSALGACYSPYAHFSGNVSSHPEYADGACTSGKTPSCYLLCSSSALWTTAGLTFPTIKVGSTTCATGCPGNVTNGSYNQISGLSPTFKTNVIAAAHDAQCTNSGNATVNPWGTTFGSIFAGAAADLAASPMWLILYKAAFYASQFGTVGQLAYQLIAAYINSKTVSGYPLKPQDVVDMWVQQQTTGWCPNAYKTCPKAAWGAGDILAYLQNINTVTC